MSNQLQIQGRILYQSDLKLIQNLIADNRQWNRTRISKELCRIWDWRMANGRLKDMSCRALLLKLHRQGVIHLPTARHCGRNHLRNKNTIQVDHSILAIETELKNILPVSIRVIKDHKELAVFRTFIANYHYLGYKGTVGEHIKYLIYNKNQQPLAALLFGAAAWQIAPRDNFIGWDNKTRKRNLPFIINNMRFLILPWVCVPNLASHILSKISRRISQDWMDKYKHPIYMLETFVRKDRFAGTCYKAANWIFVGKTKGRTRNDRHNSITAPIKDIYLYPLSKNFSNYLLT